MGEAGAQLAFKKFYTHTHPFPALPWGNADCDHWQQACGFTWDLHTGCPTGEGEASNRRRRRSHRWSPMERPGCRGPEVLQIPHPCPPPPRRAGSLQSRPARRTRDAQNPRLSVSAASEAPHINICVCALVCTFLDIFTKSQFANLRGTTQELFFILICCNDMFYYMI